jgi:glycosyltransferase involved in cell wall biosynthesis
VQLIVLHDKHKYNYTLLFNAGFLYNLTVEAKYADLVGRTFLKYAALNPTLKNHPQATSSSPGRLFWQALNDANWLVYSGMAYDLAYNGIPAADRKIIEEGAFKPEVEFITRDLQTWFDLIHNHMYPEYLALYAPFTTPMVTTVHSQMTELTTSVLKKFQYLDLVAISHMAKRMSGIDRMHVVHNSVDTDFFVPLEGSKKYLLAVGRMSKAKKSDGSFLDPKGISHAIEIAIKAGMPLKIIGNVEDPKFFETLVKPYLSDTIEFVGTVSEEQVMTRDQMQDVCRSNGIYKSIQWEEPFGIVMAEALSCGTPVIAYGRGAVSEIISTDDIGRVIDPTDGVDGFVRAIGESETIDRSTCRDYAVRHFSKKRMTDEYENVYANVLVEHTKSVKSSW